MSRILTTGAEENSATVGVEVLQAMTLAVSSAVKRSGGYSYELSSLSSGARKQARWLLSSAGAAVFYRFYLYIDTTPSAENRIFSLNGNSAIGTGVAVYLTLDNAGALRLYDEDGQVGSASSALSTATWYRIEVKVDPSGAGATDIVEARINGTSFASSSARDVANGAVHLSIGGNLNLEAQTQGKWYFDDVAKNDSAGSFQNSYPGAGSVVALRPNAAGDNTGWVPVGAASNWDCVDEVTPDDGTTCVNAILSGTIDDYNLGASAAAGIGSGDAVTLVAVGLRYNAIGASGNTQFVPRVEASSGGTVEEGVAIAPTTTTWITSLQALLIYDLPGGSTTVWTPADLDAAQIGIRVSTTGTVAAQITAMWLVVEYVPAAAVAGGLIYQRQYDGMSKMRGMVG